MLKAIAVKGASGDASNTEPLVGRAVLPHDERHLRRRTIRLDDGRSVLVDLPATVVLGAGDRLVIEGGGVVEIAAADEELYAVRGHDPVHMMELVWHIGNRHLAASIDAERILILRDHVIKAMLEGLGAHVHDVVMPFNPMRGAYSGHGHGHGHEHGNDHGHTHGHAGHGAH